MAGGKQWGQRTHDGHFALCFNPIETQPYRYPLITMTGKDGIVYDSIGVVHGEVPPRRFMGANKDFGPCYVRGITEGEQQPSDSNMWLCYSVNKEDIWVSRVQLPVRTIWNGPVNDTFDDIHPGASITNWNIYSPAWCPVFINENHQMHLTDSDRYDYARAIRVFENTKKVNIHFDLKVEKENDDPFEIDVTDRHGERVACLRLHHGIITLNHQPCGSYQTDRWLQVELAINGNQVSYGNITTTALHIVKGIERLSFRTGEYRCLPDRHTPNQEPYPPLSGCDEPIQTASYLIDNVVIK